MYFNNIIKLFYILQHLNDIKKNEGYSYEIYFL